MSFVGQVVWNTEQGLFFSLDILLFFFTRPRRFGEKKVTRNIEKKAHCLIHNGHGRLRVESKWSCPLKMIMFGLRAALFHRCKNPVFSQTWGVWLACLVFRHGESMKSRASQKTVHKTSQSASQLKILEPTTTRLFNSAV